MRLSSAKSFIGAMIMAMMLGISSCGGGGNVAKSDSDSTRVADTTQMAEPVKPGDPEYKFGDNEELRKFLSSEEGKAYHDGIIPVIAEHVPDYATKLMANEHSGFIVVDKATMRVILYDRVGQLKKSYRMACARNYGTKHKKADSRTPEGFFKVEGKYDSTDWLYVDDNGVTHPGRGAFGPRFIRIETPVTMQIGIHGTSSPGSLGHRRSHGCIRIANNNIMELFPLVEVGMPVIILPGPQDTKVNEAEGYHTAYFPTGADIVMESDIRYEAPSNPVQPADSTTIDSAEDAHQIQTEPAEAPAEPAKEAPAAPAEPAPAPAE